MHPVSRAPAAVTPRDCGNRTPMVTTLVVLAVIVAMTAILIGASFIAS